MRKQRTLNNSIQASGVGLHSGKRVKVILEPAEINTGIVFLREDRNKRIEANPENVADTQLATTISKDGVYIRTVEHLLAALFGLHIDNIIVRINAEEVPIMDGSAAPWIYLIKTAGIVKQNAYRSVIIIKKPVRIKEKGKFAAIIPSSKFEINCSINFDNYFIQKQKMCISLNENNFVKEISKARTFGFLKDIEYLQAHNLANGGSLDNAIVVDEYGIVNEDPLRYKDEFVRHKILDAMGDISMLGADIRGKYIAYKSGHDLNYKLVKKVLEDKKAYEIVGNPDKEKTVLRAMQMNLRQEAISI